MQLLILKSGWEKDYEPGEYPYNLHVLQRMQNNLYHFEIEYGSTVELDKNNYIDINGENEWINDDTLGGSFPKTAVDRIIEVP